MEEAGFSYSKTIYEADGSSSLVTIRKSVNSSPIEFVAIVNETMAAFSSQGATSKHPEALGNGEQVEKITGWVLGQKSGGQPCIFIYGPEHLQFRIDTIWQEHFQSTPFADSIEHAKQWPTASAPKRSEALAAGYLNECSYDAVMGPHPGGRKKKDSDEPLIVTLRWVGQVPDAPEPDPVQDERPAIKVDVSSFDEGAHVFGQIMESDAGSITANHITQFLTKWIAHSTPGDHAVIADCIEELVETRRIRANAAVAFFNRLEVPIEQA